MESTLNSEAAPLEPIRTDARIQALDVVRGFALLGIFLMNVEWFNRASGEMGVGLPQGLGRADWWASRLIYIFVQGKFWTMFSLLFGMGFAVMLTRAWQVIYVLAVFILQVGFSHWWLGRFRYGPMEWLWRAITYWQFPAMRLEEAQCGGTLRTAPTPAS